MRLLTTNDPSRSSLPPRHARRAGGLARTRPGREARGARREARESARSAGTCAATPGVGARVAKCGATRFKTRRAPSSDPGGGLGRWHAGIGGSGGKAPSDADIFFRGCALYDEADAGAHRHLRIASLRRAPPRPPRPRAVRSPGPMRASSLARAGAPSADARARVALSSPRPSLAPRPPPPPPPPPGVPPGHPCRRLDGPRVGPPRGDEPPRPRPRAIHRRGGRRDARRPRLRPAQAVGDAERPRGRRGRGRAPPGPRAVLGRRVGRARVRGGGAERAAPRGPRGALASSSTRRAAARARRGPP